VVNLDSNFTLGLLSLLQRNSKHKQLVLLAQNYDVPAIYTLIPHNNSFSNASICLSGRRSNLWADHSWKIGKPAQPKWSSSAIALRLWLSSVIGDPFFILDMFWMKVCQFLSMQKEHNRVLWFFHFRINLFWWLVAKRHIICPQQFYGAILDYYMRPFTASCTAFWKNYKCNDKCGDGKTLQRQPCQAVATWQHSLVSVDFLYELMLELCTFWKCAIRLFNPLLYSGYYDGYMQPNDNNIKVGVCEYSNGRAFSSRILGIRLGSKIGGCRNRCGCTVRCR